IWIGVGSRSAPMMTPTSSKFLDFLQSVTADIMTSALICMMFGLNGHRSALNGQLSVHFTTRSQSKAAPSLSNILLEVCEQTQLQPGTEIAGELVSHQDKSAIRRDGRAGPANSLRVSSVRVQNL